MGNSEWGSVGGMGILGTPAGWKPTPRCLAFAGEEGGGRVGGGAVESCAERDRGVCAGGEGGDGVSGEAQQRAGSEE